MYLKAIPLAILSTLVSTAVLATSANIYKTNEISSQNIKAYWTAARLQNATPMEIPQVETDSLKTFPLKKSKLSGKEIIGKDGQPPKVEITPDQTQVFKPKETDNLRTLDVGTAGGHFSSTRLIPTSASLSYPYRTIGRLYFKTPMGDRVCSASVIARRIILTAGHCMHNGNGQESGWYTNFLFIPAFNNGTFPYQTWTSTYAMITPNWLNSGGVVPNSGDYGMIEIADQVINGTMKLVGDVTGNLGYQLDSGIPNHATIVGYSVNLDGGNQMHQVTAQSLRAVEVGNVEYGSDMHMGSGGSPWVQNFGMPSSGQTGGTNPGRNRIIGVSSYAYNDTVTLANGSSNLDLNYLNLYNTMCARQTNNC